MFNHLCMQMWNADTNLSDVLDAFVENLFQVSESNSASVYRYNAFRL